MSLQVSEYTGYELAIGSVHAVRWFSVDRQGRLRGRVHQTIWKPGENVAACRAEDNGLNWFSPAATFTWSIIPTTRTGPVTTAAKGKPLAEEAVEARIDLSHPSPGDGCGCGFYAFAEGCDDGQYGNVEDSPWSSRPGILGVVECYGRTILGTKGLRCEKARIVALHKPSSRTRALYPDVKAYRSRRLMLARHDVIQPFEHGPETDPDFWSAV